MSDRDRWWESQETAASSSSSSSSSSSEEEEEEEEEEEVIFQAEYEKEPPCYSGFLWLVWFLCLMAYQLFLGYLMPKPFS